MNKTLPQKIIHLQQIIEKLESVVIGFSGGVDSTFLAYMCQKTLGDKAVAVTIKSIFIPPSELSSAKLMAEHIGISHHILSLEMTDQTILSNPRDRCYFCKNHIFKTIQAEAERLGSRFIVDGSNLDDLDDFRPGMKALKELKVISPFIQAGFSKSDIRAASRQAKLDTWDLPSMACLASRIPYGQKITEEDLICIDRAETYLKELGIKQARVRVHDKSARIEVAPSERQKFFDLEIMDDISRKFRNLGFRFISLDLEGYKTGKLN